MIREIMPELDSISSKNSRALSILRKKWIGLVVLQILLLLSGAQLLISWRGSQPALRWLGLAALFSLIYFGILWRRLALNYDPAERKILPEFGPGNQLTILRGILLTLLAGFLFSPWPQGWLAYVPGLLYSFAALADLFDGYLARISHHETRLGEELDLNLDGLGILIASTLLVQYGQVPAWFLLVGLARYLFIGGIWLRRRLGKPVLPLAKNSARRPFAGAQMGFVAVVLFPVFSPPGTFLAAALFAIPFLIGFTLDWFTVSGISLASLLRRDSALVTYPYLLDSDRMKVIKELASRWLPLVLRISLVILLIAWIQENMFGLFPSQRLSAADLNPQIQWIGITLLLMFSGMILIAIGVAGRIAAIIVLFAIGIYLEYFGLHLIEVLLVVGAVGLIYIGTGPYSLWIPERKIITKRLGET